MGKVINPQEYKQFLKKIRETIHQKQLEALHSVNSALIQLYWRIGQQIVENQKKFDWGKSVVQNLSTDLQKEFPGIKGFSAQNLWYMRNFYLSYSQNQRILSLILEVGWTHHITILDKVSYPAINGWGLWDKTYKPSCL